MSRSDGRLPDQLRPIRFIPHIAPAAMGSVLCCFGNTHVICTVSIEDAKIRVRSADSKRTASSIAESAPLLAPP